MGRRDSLLDLNDLANALTDTLAADAESAAPIMGATDAVTAWDNEGGAMPDPIRAELAEAARYLNAPPRGRLTADDLDRMQR